MDNDRNLAPSHFREELFFPKGEELLYNYVICVSLFSRNSIHLFSKREERLGHRRPSGKLYSSLLEPGKNDVTSRCSLKALAAMDPNNLFARTSVSQSVSQSVTQKEKQNVESVKE